MVFGSRPSPDHWWLLRSRSRANKRLACLCRECFWCRWGHVHHVAIQLPRPRSLRRRGWFLKKMIEPKPVHSRLRLTIILVTVVGAVGAIIGLALLRGNGLGREPIY